MRVCKEITAFALLAVLGGCAGPPAPDLAKAEADIRAADAQWLEAAKAHDVERTISYWSDDATLMAPGGPPVVGKDALRKFVTDSFAVPDFTITWAMDKVQLAQGGDMAYATGTNQITLTTPDGQHVVQHNNALELWRRQADGSWKCVVDVATPAEQKPPS